MQQYLRDREDLCVEKNLAGKVLELFVKHETFRFCFSICVTRSQAIVMSERDKGGRKTTRQPHRSNHLQQVQFTSITFLTIEII